MPNAFIEHVNLTVSQPERASRLLQDLFGWRVRWQGAARDGGTAIHVGGERSYIAVYAPPGEAPEGRAWAKGAPLNHVAIQVDDLAETERRVVAAGLVPFAHGDYAPGRRFYFMDWDNIEYEIVSYA